MESVCVPINRGMHKENTVYIHSEVWAIKKTEILSFAALMGRTGGH